MDKGALLDLLAEASGRKAKNATVEFAETDKASIMLSTGGPVMMIEEVSRVELKEGYALVRSGKADLFVVEQDRIIGVRLHRAKREGAGFVAG